MKPRVAAVAFALCAGAAAPVAAPAAACAGEGARAALVVDTGSAVTTYCVELPDASVSGVELVELAGEQHGLDYSLGFGGDAVCRLEGVGPDGDDCFDDYPEFWGYWHGDGSGGWAWAGTGAGSATIEDGDVEGWSWGTGDNGSNHQAPPETEHEDVCPGGAEAVAPPKKDEPKSSEGRPAASSPPPVADPAVEGDPAGPARELAARTRRPRRPKSEKHRRQEEPAPAGQTTPTPAPSVLAADPVSDDSTGGPPLTGLLGLAAAGALGAVAWRGSRRRTRT